MKIALIGYGAMGKLVKTLAENDDHKIAAIIGDSSANLSAGELAEKLKGADAAIDFSIAEAVRKNVEACVLAGVPLVEGTTGWNAELETIKSFVNEKGGAFVYGANFSIGVNLFYRIADFASELFARFEDYEAFVEEQHHSRKKDAPSGTALKLKSIVAERIKREFSVASTRAGNIPGTHRVGFDGAADQILLEHAARSREGFASGALLAAKWIVGRKGVFEFSDVMDVILKTEKTMLTLEGTYENGKIELLENPPDEVKKARVLVTFVETKEINLRERSIDERQAADLSGRLKSIAEDWNRPEMDVYDES